MLRNRRMMMSLLLLILITNLVESIDQRYVVSFVAGRTRLGLVFITQTDTTIRAEQVSIIPIGKNLGATAILVQTSWWDGGTWYNVLFINGGDAAKPLELGLIEFDWQLKKISTLQSLSQNPGQYQPLHLFQTDWSESGCCRTGTLLTAGTFGTSGSNNYVSYLIDGKARKKIFANPEDRFPGSAAVAPDGGLVSQMTFKGMNHLGYTGRLIEGKLAGSPVKWLNVNALHGYSQSLSNQILIRKLGESGTRHLLYRNFRKVGTSDYESQVMIQNINATTARPKEAPRSITNFATTRDIDAEKLQSVAVSSDGELILYTAWNNACNKQILLARRLINGFGIGEPKVVVGCKHLEEFPIGVYGINIAE